jgi:hypothetical protein
MNGSLVRSDFLTAVIGNSRTGAIDCFVSWVAARRQICSDEKVTAGMLALEIATR